MHDITKYKAFDTSIVFMLGGKVESLMRLTFVSKLYMGINYMTKMNKFEIAKKTNQFRACKFVILAILSCVSINTMAGTYVIGYGDTRAQAAHDAERKARHLAIQKGTCYDDIQPNNCVKDKEGGWTCQTVVANHRGSCGSGKATP